MGEQGAAGVGQVFFAELPACAFAAAVEHFAKAGLGDFVGACALPPVVYEQVACPGGGVFACLGQEGGLQGGEVAQAYKAGAALDGFGDFFVGQGGQDAAEAVAATGDEGGVCTAGCGAGDGGDAGGVVACKALVGGECVGVDFDLVAQFLQAGDGAFEAGCVAHCA